MQFRTYLLAAVAAVALTGTAARAQQPGLDGLVLASVNGEEITRGKLLARLVQYEGDDALEKLINRTILSQQVKAQGVTVADADVDARLKELQSKFKTDKNYRAFLHASGLQEPQFREELRNTLLIEKLALKAQPITDHDLEQYDARMLTTKDKSAAEEWIKQLNNGANFIQIARDRVQDASLKQAAGLLAPFLRIEMLDVSNAIETQKLKPGEYTKTPVELASGLWAVIKLQSILPPSTASAAELDRLKAAVTAYRVNEWMTQQRAKAEVKKNGLDQPAVAEVNGELIRREVLQRRLIEYYGHDTLERMINRTILLQAAHKHGVTLAEAEAEQAFQKIRSQFPKPEQFQAFLSQSNLNEKQFRDEIRYNMLMQRVVEKASPVTDEDLARYSIRMIVAPSPATAQTWVKELDGGADFARMAQERSMDPNGRQAGGAIRPFLKTELLDLWRAIDSQGLKPGQYTKKPVLITDDSWVLIKLEKILAADTLKPEERAAYTEQVKRYRVGQWLIQARTSAKIDYPTALELALGPAVAAN